MSCPDLPEAPEWVLLEACYQKEFHEMTLRIITERTRHAAEDIALKALKARLEKDRIAIGHKRQAWLEAQTREARSLANSQSNER